MNVMGMQKRAVKRWNMHAVAFAAASLWLALAAPDQSDALAAASSEAEPVSVVVTIKPIHGLVSQVLDGISTPKLLISGSQSPHVFALKPSDARALHEADVFIRVSPTVEPFTKKLEAALPDTVTLITLSDIPGLHLLPVRSSDGFEVHDHGHHDPHDHKHADDHNHAHHKGHKDQHTGKGPAHSDPHIWLDLKNAAVILNAVAEHFKKQLPDHAARIANNTELALAKLDELKAKLSSRLAPVKGRPFIVFHDAFQYFEKQFGLSAAGAITLHPDAPPSAKRMIEIRRKLKAKKVQCVFAEPQFDQKRLANIVEGTGAGTGVLDPIGIDVAPGTDAYEGLMRNLANGFASCLTPK